MRVLNCIFVFLIITLPAFTQGSISRGSIPAELIRPRRREAPRYPVDVVIGELGQGKASMAAYNYANLIAAGLLSGRAGYSALPFINPGLLESYLTALGKIAPRSYRIGGGREEADGSVSFLVRFIGRDYGMTGELYIRHITRHVHGDDGEITQDANWVFDELLFEEPKSHDIVQQEALSRLDLLPYERFF